MRKMHKLYVFCFHKESCKTKHAFGNQQLWQPDPGHNFLASGQYATPICQTLAFLPAKQSLRKRTHTGQSLPKPRACRTLQTAFMDTVRFTADMTAKLTNASAASSAALPTSLPAPSNLSPAPAITLAAFILRFKEANIYTILVQLQEAAYLRLLMQSFRASSHHQSSSFISSKALHKTCFTNCSFNPSELAVDWRCRPEAMPGNH